MNIAFMGIRGIPASYGGFETLADQLAQRLVKRGHQVIVYGRSNIIKKYRTGDVYKGVKLVILPTISYKYLDTPVHTLISIFHSFFHRYDIIFICNAANSIFTFLPRLTGQKVVVNVDGIERRRKKWNCLGKLWYLLGEFFSCIFPNAIVTDSLTIERYYHKRYNKASTMIPYGYNPEPEKGKAILNQFCLKPHEYILMVARFEPENGIHRAIRAFRKVKTDKKLVIVGDASYATKYKLYLHELAREDKRILFTGYVFGTGYRQLQANAYCYIHTNEVGGTPPALVETMGFGNCAIVNGTKEVREVVGDSGVIYKKNSEDDLVFKLQIVLDKPELVKEKGKKAQKRAYELYSWESITDKYEALFNRICLKKRS